METHLSGAYILEIEKREDERGFFARTWCVREFADHGLATRFVQGNVSFNKWKGTLRGLHYQAAPHGEVKLIRCTQGAIYDVIVDLRSDSSTYQKWMGVELAQGDGRLLYVPEQFAHGFQTLEDDSEVSYEVSEFYTPEFERGVRYDDPAFGIKWPLDVAAISAKDRTWADFDSVAPLG